MKLLSSTSSTSLHLVLNQLIEELNSYEYNHTTLNKARLAMNLSLITLALESIPRIMKLSSFASKLEEKIFDQEKVHNLNPQQQIELYKLAVEKQNSNIQFTDFVLRSIKWEDLVLSLQHLINSEKENTITAENTLQAKEIINKVAELKKSGLIPGGVQKEFSKSEEIEAELITD